VVATQGGVSFSELRDMPLPELEKINDLLPGVLKRAYG
jgi:hypothetical protein